MPPPNIPLRETTAHNVPATSYNTARPSSGTNGAFTPDPKGKAPMIPRAHYTGLHTSVHTPAGRPAQGGGGDRMAQNLANRHAARLRQIQEAQEAQLREEEASRAQAKAVEAADSVPAERRVNLAHQKEAIAASARAPVEHDTLRPTAVSSGTSVHTARPSPPQVPLRSSDTAPDADADEYHFPSEDDAFLASLDLDALDEGIGRPIDFDEGLPQDVDMGMAMGNAGVYNPANHAQQGDVHQQPEKVHATTSATSGSSSGVCVGITYTGQEKRPLQVRFGQGAPGQGSRPRTPSMGGGFHFSLDDVVVRKF
ncbi:hypothetical protein BC628DRAFT_948883 [Trametes gibbosa]|nr:hypothetical protein BC628DRAFT_948883 [Trametes gibbosa]